MPVLRKIVRIDEERCTGCGDCILACAESAIEIVDGKARLVGESLCDGFGACLGKCPEDAIHIEEREAEAFDEEAVKERLADLWMQGADLPKGAATPANCPSSQVMALGESGGGLPQPAGGGSAISHWPIKLNLVSPEAPFLQGADVVLMADCVPFALGDGYREYVSDHALLIGCPKFDTYDFAFTRLTEILRCSDVRSLTVVHMEVPCCGGYWHLGQEACTASGKSIPLQQVVIGVRGDVKTEPV